MLPHPWLRAAGRPDLLIEHVGAYADLAAAEAALWRRAWQLRLAWWAGAAALALLALLLGGQALLLAAALPAATMPAPWVLAAAPGGAAVAALSCALVAATRPAVAAFPVLRAQLAADAALAKEFAA